MVDECDWRGLIRARPVAASLVVRAVLPQKPQGGGSRPVLVRADDGNRYWLKALNNPQRSRVVINEQVAARCGGLIGAPTCSVTLLEIPPEIAGYEFGPRLYLEQGIAHGSLDVANAVLSRTLDHRTADDNARRHVALFALCDWLGGRDHQWLYDAGDEMRTYSHDHGYYFPGGPAWTADELRAQVTVPSMLPQDPSGLARVAIDSVAQRISDVTRQQLVDLLSSVPQPWPIDDSELETLGWFLEERREAVAERIRAL